MKKRYQYYSKDGIKWTPWFKETFEGEHTKWQLKNRLLNEWTSD